MASRKRTPVRSAPGPTIDAGSAITALQNQKERGLAISSNPRPDPTARQAWYNTTAAILAAAFGPDSPNIGAVMNAGPPGRMYPPSTPDAVIEAANMENLRAAATMLDSCIEQLQLLAPAPASSSRTNEAAERVDKVFLGHGRDLVWSKVERWLEKDKGIPVEAWESESHTGEQVVQVLERILDSCTFAVLVFTGEDAAASGTLRARQNVIHEIGLFQGKLGFKKVALLEQDGTESFSNIDGLQTIRFPSQRIEAAFPELERMMKREGLIK